MAGWHAGAQGLAEESAAKGLNVQKAIANSCLLPFLEQELRAASLNDMSKR